MFKKLVYIDYFNAIERHKYELEDTEFGRIDVWDETLFECHRMVFAGVVIVKEYSKRNLDVGKNLALSILASYAIPKSDIDRYCKMQDTDCPQYISNWSDYIPGRNEWLGKLMLLQ